MSFQSHLPFSSYLLGQKNNNGTNESMEKWLAESLFRAGLIAEEQLRTVQQQQKTSGKNLEEIVLEQGWVKPQTLLYFKENVKFPGTGNHNFEPEKTSVSNDLIFKLSAKRVFRTILAIISFFIAANLFGHLSQRYLPDFFLRDFFSTQFNLDGELTVPAVYSAMTLLFCSILLGLIAFIKKNKHDLYTIYWQGLSIIFAFMFFDELASLHEQFIVPVGNALNTRGFLLFAWVIPGSFAVLVFILVFLKFIINLPQKTRNHFVLAGAIYIGGAIGCELIGGYIVDTFTAQSILYLLEFTVEESLEMLGIAVFIYGLLSHISSSNQDTVVKIQIPGKKLRLSTHPTHFSSN